VNDETQSGGQDKGIDLATALARSPQIPVPEKALYHALRSMRDILTQILADPSEEPPLVDPESGRPVYGPCTRCGYTWMGHLTNPKVPRQCARCHSPAWQTQKRAVTTESKWKGKRESRTTAKRKVDSASAAVASAPVPAASPVDAYFPPLPRDMHASEHSPGGAMKLPPPPPPVIVMPSLVPPRIEREIARAESRAKEAEVQKTYPSLSEAIADSPPEVQAEFAAHEKGFAEAQAKAVESMTKEEMVDVIRQSAPTPAQAVREFISQQEPPSLSPSSDVTDSFFKPTEDAKRAFFADPIDLTPRIKAVDDGTPPPSPVPDEKVIVNTANLDAVLAKLGKK
jgi:hypothetical protein